MPGSVTSGFWPTRSPRPEYPPVSFAIKSFLKPLKGCLITALATLALAPAYLALVASMERREWSERLQFTVLAATAHSVAYLACNLFFEVGCDRLGWFGRYAIERKPIQRPSWGLLCRTWGEAVVGQLAITPMGVWLIYPMLGVPPAGGALPPLAELWWQYALAHLFNDFFFYWTHRLVHMRWLYTPIHKKHHTYTGTVSWAAEYAHPVESLVSNLFPTMGGVLLFGRHPLVVCLWLVHRLQATYEAHSGYCFYGSWLHRIGLTNADAAAWHDYHHTGNQGNFGAAWLDWLCGTMDHYCEMGLTPGYLKRAKAQLKIGQADGIKAPGATTVARPEAAPHSA